MKIMGISSSLMYLVKSHALQCISHLYRVCINIWWIPAKIQKNIDCFENIVCLCPNCHREVHYGELSGKFEKIKIMFKQQEDKLRGIGLIISEDNLLSLYQNSKLNR